MAHREEISRSEGANERSVEATPTRSGGVTLERYFTRVGVDPMSEVDWDLRAAVISGEDGRVVFEQREVEVPRGWSQTATNVVVSAYFRGPIGSPRRWRPVCKANWSAGWSRRSQPRGERQRYFAGEGERETFKAELTYLLVNQLVSFNSPWVWFNVGNGAKPQCSACFILKVDDKHGLDPELVPQRGDDLQRRIGVGRESVCFAVAAREAVGGRDGVGLLSFMKAADASAGVIKSGGKTRRAAKMVVHNEDHPDIVDFIKCKFEEEKKAWALIEAGYDGSLDGPAVRVGKFLPERQQLGAGDRQVYGGDRQRRELADAVCDERRGGGGASRARDSA